MRLRHVVLVIAPLLLLAACDAGSRAASLQITGDTLVYAAVFELPNGMRNADCGFRVTARARGGRGDTAVIRQGRVKYTFVKTGQEHATWEWTPERLPSIWPNPRIAAGDTVTSKTHDIAFSLPFQPVRGEVVFDYTVPGDDAVHTTEPFTFTCL